ncbi:hypothetical protein A4F85_06695 [Delftia sp. GW456-R20]|nr:hypothetical protein A4F85_06695 [Delftia sp. GW456-R20]
MCKAVRCLGIAIITTLSRAQEPAREGVPALFFGRSRLMGMPIKLSVFEALTEAGVTPDKARAVERELENAIQTGQDAVRAEMRDQVMTKSDGAELKSQIANVRTEISASETRLNARLNDQLRWIITTQITVVGLAIAAVKLL